MVLHLEALPEVAAAAVGLPPYVASGLLHDYCGPALLLPGREIQVYVAALAQ